MVTGIGIVHGDWNGGLAVTGMVDYWNGGVQWWCIESLE